MKRLFILVIVLAVFVFIGQVTPLVKTEARSTSESHLLFEATPHTLDSTYPSPWQGRLSYAGPESVELCYDRIDSAVISRYADGTGQVVIDNYIEINGSSPCGDQCFGGLIVDPPVVGDPVESNLIAIDPINVSSYLINGANTFELWDYGWLYGNTDLYLVVTGEPCATFSWGGFLPPVDDFPTVNVVKAGGAVPIKFSLGGYWGMDILAPDYPKSISVACDVNAPVSAVDETVTAGSSSLSYDAASDQYVYVWKTQKDWTGCRQLEVMLSDGSTYSALFSFAK